MTKSEIIDHLSDKADISKIKAAAALNALVDLVTQTVGGGGKIAIPGVGSFERVYRPARAARIVMTGEEIAVPEKFAPKFKASKQFKDAMPAPNPVKSPAKGARKRA